MNTFAGKGDERDEEELQGDGVTGLLKAPLRVSYSLIEDQKK